MVNARSRAASRLSIGLPEFGTESEIVERFEIAWRDGGAPRIEEFVHSERSSASGTGQHATAVLAELVKIDLEYRWRQAEMAFERASGADKAESDPGLPLPDCPLLEDYLERFPELATSTGAPLDLISEEYRVRRRWGDRPSPGEYAARFGGWTEALRAALAAVDAELLAEAGECLEATGITPAESTCRGGPILCPQCHLTVDPVVEPWSRALTCPGCGGRFASESPPPGPAVRPPFQKVGRYELRGLLGTGGFGTVWRAWDDELQREVAVKLPRGARFSSAAEEERFLREARFSGQLRHPGIVAVHDAGRDQGTVFIVSDLVRGPSLAQWLGHNRLSFREAAALAAQVADALESAHVQGVIHRDLKPSNILLERDETPALADALGATRSRAALRPRVVDFGLAKRDAGEVTMTHDGQLLGTPAYMSPEQIRTPHAVDARSDLYSLGVILYQILTDALPFLGVSRMLQLQVLEDEPRAPRRLNDHIPRDLETITLFCLAKDPAHRYASAGALAEDLRRFLGGEPVRARPVGRLERIRRWCLRNPVVAGLTAGLVVALACGFLGITWQWVRAEREKKLADRSFQAARQAVDDYLTSVSENTLLKTPGLEALRKTLLARALKYYQSFIETRGSDPSVRAELAAAHANVARITAVIGSAAEAQASYQRALELYRELIRHHPQVSLYRDKLAGVYNNIALMQERIGRPKDARANHEEARSLYENLSRAEPGNLTYRRALAGSLGNIATVDDRLGHMEACLAGLQRVAELFEVLVRDEPNEPARKNDLAMAFANIGLAFYRGGRYAESRPAYERAREIQKALIAEQPDVPEYRFRLAITESHLALLLVHLEEGALARASYDEAFKLLERLTHDQPDVHEYRRVHGLTLCNFGLMLADAGAMNEALPYYQRALTIEEGLMREQPGVAVYRDEYARTINNLGIVYQSIGRPLEALEAYEQSLELGERNIRGDTNGWESRGDLGRTYGNLAALHKSLGHLKEAEELGLKGLAYQREALKAAPSAEGHRRSLTRAIQQLAELYRNLGRHAEAAALAREHQSLWPAEPADLYNASCELALCVPLVEPGQAEPTAAGRAERLRYADDAIAALRQAIKAGFRDVKQLTSDPDFVAIRPRADFQAIVQQLGEL
jgi:serine/threonine protein kinase